jgi:broad specificity phosphatase PhoE
LARKIRKRVTGLRHAKADAATAPGHEGDIARVLGKVGINQAHDRLGGSCFYEVYDRVGSSPAERAVHTVAIVGRRRRNEIELIDELCFKSPEAGADWAAFDAAFHRHGYAPLSLYLDDPEAGEAVERIGNGIWPVLETFINRNDNDEKLLLGGHAVMSVAAFLPAVRGTEFEEPLKAISLGEAHGFVVVFEDGGVVGLEVLPD